MTVARLVQVSTDNRITQLLKREGSASQAAVSRGVSLSITSTRKALTRLVAEGRVSRRADGAYEIADLTSAARTDRQARALALLGACEAIESVANDGGSDDYPRVTYDRDEGAWKAEAAGSSVDMASLVGSLLALGAEVQR